jgi:hypothetical protein
MKHFIGHTDNIHHTLFYDVDTKSALCAYDSIFACKMPFPSRESGTLAAELVE